MELLLQSFDGLFPFLMPSYAAVTTVDHPAAARRRRRHGAAGGSPGRDHEERESRQPDANSSHIADDDILETIRSVVTDPELTASVPNQDP
jgi:hypothetical protein